MLGSETKRPAITVSFTYGGPLDRIVSFLAMIPSMKGLKIGPISAAEERGLATRLPQVDRINGVGQPRSKGAAPVRGEEAPAELKTLAGMIGPPLERLASAYPNRGLPTSAEFRTICRVVSQNVGENSTDSGRILEASIALIVSQLAAVAQVCDAPVSEALTALGAAASSASATAREALQSFEALKRDSASRIERLTAHIERLLSQTQRIRSGRDLPPRPVVLAAQRPSKSARNLRKSAGPPSDSSPSPVKPLHASLVERKLVESKPPDEMLESGIVMSTTQFDSFTPKLQQSGLLTFQVIPSLQPQGSLETNGSQVIQRSQGVNGSQTLQSSQSPPGLQGSQTLETSQTFQVPLRLEELKTLIADFLSEKQRYDSKSEGLRLHPESLSSFERIFFNSRYKEKTSVQSAQKRFREAIEAFRLRDFEVLVFSAAQNELIDEHFLAVAKALRSALRDALEDHCVKTHGAEAKETLRLKLADQAPLEPPEIEEMLAVLPLPESETGSFLARVLVFSLAEFWLMEKVLDRHIRLLKPVRDLCTKDDQGKVLVSALMARLAAKGLALAARLPDLEAKLDPHKEGTTTFSKVVEAFVKPSDGKSLLLLLNNRPPSPSGQP